MSHQVMREPVHDAVLREPLLRRIQDVRKSGGTYQQQVAVRKAQGSLIASQRLYYGGFNALDGSFVLGALTRQNREAARGILGIQDATDTPDFDANDPLNRQRVESWRRDIQRILAQRPVAEWVGRFLAAGVPASIVQVPEEMADDPQVIANGMMTELVHEVTGTQQVVSPLVAMSKTPTAARIPAPVLGAHSREILIELGWSEGEVDELVAAHVVSHSE
jgi:formyl-CoA transferase